MQPKKYYVCQSMMFLRSVPIYVFHDSLLYWDVLLLFYILNNEYVAFH